MKTAVEEERILTAQMGREPRRPWRVSSVCVHGHPSSIVSPSRLEDGTPFPTWAWLTCPWLADRVSTMESAAGAARWAERALSDPELARRLRDADALVRAARAAEGGGADECDSVGIAGQRDPLATKCLHAHTAVVLAGIDDPIGSAIVGEVGAACPDARCERLLGSDGAEP